MNSEITSTEAFQPNFSDNRAKIHLDQGEALYNSEEANQRFSTAGSDEEDIEIIQLPEKQNLHYKTYSSNAEAIYCCKFDPQDEFIAAGTSTGTIHVFSVYGSSKMYTGRNFCLLNDHSTDPITSLRWHPKKNETTGKNILTTSSSDGKISEWDITSGKTLFTFQEKNNENVCLDYNKDGSLFATGGKDKKVRLYDDATKKLKQTFEAITWLSGGHTNRIFSVKFHPEDPNVILSAGWDKHVYIWDMRAGRSVGSIYGPSTISGESLDMKGNLILTGSYRSRDQLELWDFGSRKKVSGIDWEFGYARENAYVFSCQFSKFNDESIIAGCSRINQVKLFDRRDQNKDYVQIDNKNSAVFCADFANTNDFYCFAGEGGAVKVGKIILKHEMNK